jgi:hypothetical protein
MKFSTLLNEGKKENLISKYGDEPIYKDNDFISKIIDSDPSSTKKYSEWTIKQVIEFMKINDGASLPDVITQITDLINTFHDLSLTITDKDIDLAKKLHSGINDTYIKGAPKDIHRYKSYWELQTVLSAMDKKKKDRELEREAIKDTDKLYEDSRFLVVRPYSHDASCYYGANTKWCTASKDNRSYFNRYGDSGVLVYVIDKQSSDETLGKMAININENGNIWIYDQKDNQRSEDFLLDRFEPISEVLKKILKGNTDYEKLIKVKEGKLKASKQTLTARYFYYMDTEQVYLRFEGAEEFLSIMNEQLEDYELSSYSNAIELPYGMDNYYYDRYNFEEDIKEGYPLYSLNSSHLKTLKKILELLGDKFKGSFKTSPNVSREKLKKFKELGKDLKDYYELYDLSLVDNDNFPLSKMGDFLMNFDNDFYESFDDAYGNAQDESMKIGVQKALTDELCNLYEPEGFKLEDTCFYEYSVSIDDLIKMYDSNIEYSKSLSLKEMLEWYMDENISMNVEEPHNMAYEHVDEETFKYYFDSPMDSALDKLLEKIEESDDYVDIEEYKRIFNVVEKKFGFNEKIEVETLNGPNGDVTIEIKGIKPEDNKIDFELRRNNPQWKLKKGRAKLSTIEKLISNYQLFDPFED